MNGPRLISANSAREHFARIMRRAFPGDGSESPSKRLGIACADTAKQGHDAHAPAGVASGSARPIITEADIAAKVQNTVGTGPDFDTLLTDPEYDRRATAIPAAREEQE